MITPPWFAAWLLAAAVSRGEREFVLGDLDEEFATIIVPERGRWRANWWYRRQVALSLAPLVFRAWERASLGRASTAVLSAAIAATLPACALIVIRTFVLQQVPLKASADASNAFLAVLAAVVLLAGGLGMAAAVRILNTPPRER